MCPFLHYTMTFSPKALARVKQFQRTKSIENNNNNNNNKCHGALFTNWRDYYHRRGVYYRRSRTSAIVHLHLLRMYPPDYLRRLSDPDVYQARIYAGMRSCADDPHRRVCWFAMLYNKHVYPENQE